MMSGVVVGMFIIFAYSTPRKEEKQVKQWREV